MNSDINTNVRLFDLVRYMRSELHEADLITDQEYFWLCAEAPMAKGQGSPSPRRLEDYDEIRAKMKRMESALKSIAAHDGPGFPHGTCAKIAAERLEACLFVIRELVNELPTNRDWLNPDLEKAAREILSWDSY